MTETPVPSIRLDKWLWHARFCKTRSLAQKWCASGQVSVNGASIHKPATSVKPGDVVSFLSGPYRRTVVVQAPGERRGRRPRRRRFTRSRNLP